MFIKRNARIRALRPAANNSGSDKATRLPDNHLFAVMGQHVRKVSTPKKGAAVNGN